MTILLCCGNTGDTGHLVPITRKKVQGDRGSQMALRPLTLSSRGVLRKAVGLPFRNSWGHYVISGLIPACHTSLNLTGQSSDEKVNVAGIV